MLTTAAESKRRKLQKDNTETCTCLKDEMLVVLLATADIVWYILLDGKRRFQAILICYEQRIRTDPEGKR